MNRFLWPLIGFVLLVVLLAVGLNLNPRDVPSPLVGKPAPAFTLARLDAPVPPLRLAGEMPSAANPPAGCHFHPRCTQAIDACRARYPEATELSPTHRVSCHLC